jgi:hypothetical protein
MFGISVPAAAAWLNAAFFALASFANLGPFRRIREIYERWDIPKTSYRTLGLVQIFAAALLAFPSFRSWGVALAAPTVFGWTILLLDHRQYLGALGLSFALAALAVVMVDSPSAPSQIHYSVTRR